MDENRENFGINYELPTRRCYSNKELESLRFENIDDQRRKWEEIYRSLSSEVLKEYDGLRSPDHRSSTTKQQQKKKNNKNKKKDAPSKIKTKEATEEIGTLGTRYSRGEMEALRFADVRGQQRLWAEVYSKLGSDVAEEFDGLWQHRMGEDLRGNMLNISDPCNDTLAHSGNRTDVEYLTEEYDYINDGEDESSGDEFYNIQKPAFLVEGEPDFESGPPLDGLEYLRRVRWEAAHIPKVKVVKLSSDKLNNDQTPYMPSIPEIPKCPPNLLPSKTWEKAFLDGFSELRRSISALDESCNQLSLPMVVGTGPCKQSGCIQQLNKKSPTLSVILGMDAVWRAATLRNSIGEMETASTISREDCLWLFALCAAVDTPLHADTCASLRCLLRTCFRLLSLKSERDDEVAMLSVLIAVAGRYFGQLDNL